MTPADLGLLPALLLGFFFVGWGNNTQSRVWGLLVLVGLAVAVGMR